ncbi:MAG: DUF2953 domain-containing protein [Gorillibacterium sp.]|nr:DUF2953 domain-containing protein [Gorillibacterium sp.]
MGWIIGLSLATLVCVVISIILLSNIRFHILFVRVKSDDRLRIEVKALFGIYRYCYEIPQIDYISILEGTPLKIIMKGKGPGIHDKPKVENEALNKNFMQNNVKMFKLFVQGITNYKEWFRASISHLGCSEFSWVTRFGMGEPALTASLTGVGWTVKYGALGFISHLIPFKTAPKLDIQPQFNSFAYETELQARLQMKMASVVMSGIKLLFRMHRLKDLRKMLKLMKSIRKQRQLDHA